MSARAGREDTEARALALLRSALGECASFRDGQLEAILGLVDDRARVLLVQRTGWGKSLVYFISTRILRDGGAGPTLLVSPLLSLMRDQLRMAREALGVSAYSINSENENEWSEVDRLLAEDAVDVLLVSPERLGNDRFRRKTLALMERGIGMFVVDEAHCISDWGHDFRPNYRRIRNLVTLLPQNVPLLATTATANDRVVADVEEQLGPDLRVVRGPLGRDSLRLQAIPLADQAERLAWLAEHLDDLPGSGIVYCLTVDDCERVAAWLSSQGQSVAAYHGRLETNERIALEEALRANQVKALVATVALGMGFDKPDLGFIVHFQRPGSVVTYYQQIGRAGRAVERADVVLLAGEEDDAIEEFFISSAFPPERHLREVIGVVGATENGSTLTEIAETVNATEGQINKSLQVLELENAIFKDGSRYLRTANPWAPDTARIEGVTEMRRHELERMREFVESHTCLMEFLQQDLDDPSAAPCGRCAVCAGDFIEREVGVDSVVEAGRFLRRIDRPIEPRRKWPNGAVGGRRGLIPEGLRAEWGRALSVYGDAGWGRLVKAGKYGGDEFSDELLEAAAELIEQDWQPDPAPLWVVPMPSRRSEIVPEFAARLAERLGLEYREALIKVNDTPPQKTMQNSQQQLRNVLDAFQVVEELVRPEPLLLVDDMVDSRWSITEGAQLLRSAGSGIVYPFALADSSRRGSD
jgi:ATP-dependent DNA helicase RecQ